jgi:hypothetical protein
MIMTIPVNHLIFLIEFLIPLISSGSD